jgi:hypothetical protein
MQLFFGLRRYAIVLLKKKCSNFMRKYTKLNIILHSVSLFRGLYLMVQSSSQNSSCRCMREGNFKTHMFINRENFALPKKFGPYLV